MNNEELKLKLEEEFDLVEQELADLGVEDIDETATQQDELADRQEEHGENLSEKSALGARKLEIMAALKRMQDGTYGMCEECGEKIDEERLEANPAARTCRLHME